MEVIAMMETVIAKSTSGAGLRRSIGQSLLSLSFSTGGLLTGTLLVLYFDIFSIKGAPWALVLFPGILSVRGAIGGLFSGHLSTGLHLGTIRASYTRNTSDFRLLLHGVITLALISGIVVGIVTSIFGVFLWKATIVDFVKLLAVIIATMALSVIFISPITIAVSIFSFRRGLDPDVIVYPTISTVADVTATACYILSLNIFFTLNHFGYLLIGILDLVFLFVVVHLLVKNFKEDGFARIMKEFLLTLMFVASIVNVTGAFLNKISGIIGNRTEIYVVYPALITTTGGVGSIVGSTATTKLALGSIKPSFSSMKQHLNEIGGSWIASIAMFAFYFTMSSFTGKIPVSSHLLRFLAQLLTTNILAISAIVILSYAVAFSTHRRGWNPDNFVIPIESSLADSVTTISLLIALTAIV